MRHSSTLFFVLMSVGGVLLAEEPCCCPTIMCQGEPFDPCELPAGYGQFAGVEVDGCVDISVTADFIYWKPVRRNRVDIFQFQNDPSNTILMSPEKIGYRPGFKVGLGMTVPSWDDWNFQAVYTWYHHDFTKTFGTSGNQTISPVAVPLLFVPFTSIKSTMKFDYDDIRLSVHRPIYAGCKMIFDPFVGLRGVWRKTGLSQELRLIPPLVLPGTAGLNFQNAKVHAWYAAMIAGGNVCYLFGPGFKVLFKAELGLGYERITKNRSEVFNNSFAPLPAAIIQEYPKNPWVVQGMATGMGGIGWGSYFCCQKYHFDISAQYEFEAIWGGFLDYNTVLFLTDTVFRGLTVHAGFDF
ncbi:MAG: hypothetical protein JSS30_06490 [Verrucomicrobia bacterium]|nr:hypothetical protein [Verrucomicrobiota bacterium]